MSQPFYASSLEQMPSREEMLSLSGMEFIQAMLEGRFAGPPISSTLNFTLVAAEKGRTVFRGSPQFAALNPMGGVHGGWYGTVLDSALGCAVMTIVPQGHWYTTLEYKVNITRALPMGLEVECHADVVHSGRTTAVAEGRIVGVADGKIYATGSTTCIIMKG